MVPLYLDRHDVPGATPADVAAAHAADLGVQDEFGVTYLTYWFEPTSGAVFCLAEGPDIESVDKVHRRSTGLTATTIVEVEPGPVQAFFGTLPNYPPGEPYVESAVRAVLFTDICGSTVFTQELGDDASTALVKEHDGIVRRTLVEHHGTEVKHTGDGIMASFRSVSAAVEAAIDIQIALAKRNLDAEHRVDVSIGISAGEPITDHDDLFGTAVQLAARLCTWATPGQIAASVAVRELCAGKLLRFVDSGSIPLKGFADLTQVYNVTWN